MFTVNTWGSAGIAEVSESFADEKSAREYATKQATMWPEKKVVLFAPGVERGGEEILP